MKGNLQDIVYYFKKRNVKVGVYKLNWAFEWLKSGMFVFLHNVGLSDSYSLLQVTDINQDRLWFNNEPYIYRDKEDDDLIIIIEENEEYIKNLIKRRKKMNQFIIEHFEKTKDAVLVDKWFGEEIEDNNLFRILISGKENEILNEAKKLENDEKNNYKK